MNTDLHYCGWAALYH